MKQPQRHLTEAEKAEIRAALIESGEYEDGDEIVFDFVADFEAYGFVVDVQARTVREVIDGDRITARSIDPPVSRVIGPFRDLEIWVLHPAAAKLMTGVYGSTPISGRIFEGGDLWDDVPRRSRDAICKEVLPWIVREQSELATAA